MCVLSHVRLSVTLWTAAARLLCLWDSPGKKFGVVPLLGYLPNPWEVRREVSAPPHAPLRLAASEVQRRKKRDALSCFAIEDRDLVTLSHPMLKGQLGLICSERAKSPNKQFRFFEALFLSIGHKQSKRRKKIQVLPQGLII